MEVDMDSVEKMLVVAARKTWRARRWAGTGRR